jgi:Restriction endonuclease
MSRSSPAWERYERLIARMFADQISTDYCVTPNAHLVGRISKRSRQIDVLIELRHDTDNSRRIIVDAKKRARKIDVKDVEAFRGLMEDVGATHGYLICPNGHTKSAERRAQSAVSIRLVPLDRLEDFDPSTWPACKAAKCKNGRVFWDGYPELTMRLKPLSGPDQGRLLEVRYIHYVGKCDRCGRFHVKCITCGDILAPPEDDDADYGHQCRCRPPWFWLASIEEDDEGVESAELHAVILPAGDVMTADRRSLQ